MSSALDRPSGAVRRDIVQYRDGRTRRRRDVTVTEEPLEIRLATYGGGDAAPVAVTMRTPGNDFDLAAGFLFTEGIIAARDEIARINYCRARDLDPAQRYNVVTVELRPGAGVDPEAHRRAFYATSSCGVCGKASLEAVFAAVGRPVTGGPTIAAETLLELPDRMRRAQPLFDRTGGIHAAALFAADGTLRAAREDVGRHNAVDKLIGSALLEGKSLGECVMAVSGRAGFEIVQKAARAGIGFVASVSAPSSLAVQLAEELNMTLAGFVRGDRFNVYTGAHRVRIPGAGSAEAPAEPKVGVPADGPLTLSVVGHSGSGKTTLIEAMIAQLRRAGLRVGCVKHTHHAGVPGDAGKDDRRHREAGAAVGVLAGPRRLLTVLESAEPFSAEEAVAAARRFAGEPLDVVLVEGYKGGPYPKVLVRSRDEMNPLSAEGLHGVVAVVGAADPAAPDLHRFDRNDATGLVAFLLSGLRARPAGGEGGA